MTGPERTLRLRARGDRTALEALQLEIARLAREHGFALVSVDIAPATAPRARGPRRALSARRPARPRPG